MSIVWFHYGLVVFKVAVYINLFYYGRVSLYYVQPTSTIACGFSPSVKGIFKAYLIYILILQSKDID